MIDSDLQESMDSERPEDGEDDPLSSRSLSEDVSNLIDDGKTYVEAEIAFQKSRLSFVSNRGKSGAIFVLAALGMLHLALIGLVVGGIFALAPILGALGAMLAVVGGLLLAMTIFLMLARSKLVSLKSAFRDPGK